MSVIKIIALIFMLAFSFTGIYACPDNDGPAEEAGEKIDDAADEAGDKMEDAADKAEDTVD